MNGIRIGLLSLLAVVVMWKGSFAALSESPAAVQFYVETPVVSPGDTLVLALHIAEPVDFYYAGFEVGFNSGTFSLLDVQHSGLSSPGLSVAELIRVDRVGASVSRISQLPEPASGQLAVIRFVVNTTAVPDSYAFEIAHLEMADSNGEHFAVLLPDQLTVSVEEPEPEYVPSAFVLAAFDLNETMVASQAQFVNRNTVLELFGASLTGFAAGFEGQAANSNAWMGGSDGSAYWQVTISTEGFKDISVSSRQFGSGSGPRDFLLYGSINTTDWIPLRADTIRLSASSWNAAHIDNLRLPNQFEDQPTVTLRWVMASEARIDNGEPLSSPAGTSRIDDIRILGYQLDPDFIEVWPGDTNNDGVVNADDVLPLGLYWMHTGLLPFAQSTDFAPRTVEQWVPSGATFADTNGDGIVDHRDLQWIGMHFGKSRLGKRLPDGSVPAAAEPVARMVLHEGLVMGRELRIGLLDDALTELRGAAWRLRIHGAHPDDFSVVLPPVSSDKLTFLTSPEEGVFEGAVVLKSDAGSESGGYQIELGLQLYEDIAYGLELELERLTVMDSNGGIIPASFPVLERLDVVSVRDSDSGALPGEVSLEANYPNPFNPTTMLRFSLPEAMHIRLEVFDMTGRRVSEAASGFFPAGRHTVTFDGSGLASGMYVYRLHASGRFKHGKMTLVK